VALMQIWFAAGAPVQVVDAEGKIAVIWDAAQLVSQVALLIIT
jgi:hypothetical protein